MRLGEKHKQQVAEAIKKSLTFDILYQRVKPDVSAFISATSALPLKNLRQWEQWIRWQIDVHLDKPPAGTDKPPAGSLQWLDLCHGNGYRRERALRGIATGAPNGFLLALVVRRLNDWVPQVREAACNVLPVIAAASDPERVVDVLFVILPGWHAWGRAGEQEKAVLATVMANAGVTAALKKRLITASSGPVATVFSQAGRTRILDPFIAELAEQAVQPALRARACRCLLEGKIVWSAGMQWQWIDKVFGVRRRVPVLQERIPEQRWPFADSLKLAIHDRSPRVRRIAGEMLIKESEALGEEALTLAVLLAADPAESVAERGRFALAYLAKQSSPGSAG